MKVSFFHARYFDTNGNLQRSGATYAYRELEPGKIEYAAAFCHPKDNFNKRLGRVKAEGRLKSDRFRLVFHGDRTEFLQAIKAYTV